jgi:diketogulonate reductase-like aldo/keto reductase
MSKEAIVKAILEVGYRHLDTAWLYQNEEIIGEALKEVLATGKV